MVHQMPSYKVAIIGAGPAGCMLARLLHRQHILVTIFEGESSPNFRSQGGTLDLHTTTGQAALKQADLYDEFLKYARYDGEAMALCDKRLLNYIKSSGGKEGDRYGRPEIDRPALRQLLYESLPADLIKWGYRLRRVDEHLRLHFDQGIESGFDLIVGADGAWSRVRPILSDVKPFYSGISGLSMKLSDAANKVPDLYKLVNRGSLFSFSDGKSIMAQYMGSGEISVATWETRPENWIEETHLDTNDVSACKAAIKKYYEDWDPRLVDFTQKADSEIVARSLYMLPVGHRWDNRPGVTLVGDSAHLMTPFAGEGVNLALTDALELANAVTRAAQKDHQTSREALYAEVKKFEKDMFRRATRTQQSTWNNLELMYLTPGAPRSTIERYIIGMTKHEFGEIWTPLIAVLAYIYFFFFKLIYR